MNYFDKVRDELKTEIFNIKAQGNKFSVSFDEWTSMANKRYMNVILHGDYKFWNLGLVKITGAATAERIVEMLESRLLEFDLLLSKDIVSIISDGAQTMVKVGKLIKPNQQLCYAHGIQLGVIDVLYKKRSQVINTEVHEFSDDDDMLIDDTDGQCDSLQVLESNDRNEITEEFNFRKIINDVRNVVRSFRKSPKKNEILQKYVRMEFKKELNLILDCQTRWNSLLKMLERFLLLESSLKKAVVDLKCKCLLGITFHILKDVVDVLKPSELAIEALCRRDMNLCTADAAINFMLNEIKNVKSLLAYEMYLAIKSRVEERTTIYTPLLKLLTTSAYEYSTSIKIKQEMTHELVLLLTRLNENKDFSEDSEEDVIENAEKSLKEKLNEALEAAKMKKIPNSNGKLEDTILKEINFLLGGGNRGINLDKAHKYLSTIPPTSVECERCFSSSGRICTKIRSSLADDTLNAIVFLKSYFKNNN